jgi:hypothetical protein
LFSWIQRSVNAALRDARWLPGGPDFPRIPGMNIRIPKDTLFSRELLALFVLPDVNRFVFVPFSV